MINIDETVEWAKQFIEIQPLLSLQSLPEPSISIINKIMENIISRPCRCFSFPRKS